MQVEQPKWQPNKSQVHLDDGKINYIFLANMNKKSGYMCHKCGCSPLDLCLDYVEKEGT